METPVDLSVVAIWICAREYGGIWHHSKESGPYEGKEVLGFLGDMRMTTIRNLIVSLGGVRLKEAERPPWYTDSFGPWAREILLRHSEEGIDLCRRQGELVRRGRSTLSIRH
jgi:hypothetical protein